MVVRWDKVSEAFGPAMKKAPEILIFGLILAGGLLAQSYMHQQHESELLRYTEQVQIRWADSLTKLGMAVERHNEVQIHCNAQLESLIRQIQMRG